MENEIMAKAISGIDDSLILEAAETPRRQRFSQGLKALSIAACFMLIVSGFILSRGFSDSDITVYGKAVGTSPTLLDMPAHVMSAASKIVDPALSVLIETSGEVLTVSHGIMEIYSVADNTLLYEGNRYDGSKAESLEILWIITDPSRSEEYVLYYGSEHHQLLLRYSEEANGWTVQKSVID